MLFTATPGILSSSENINSMARVSRISLYSIRMRENTDTFHGMTVSKWKQLIAEENEGTPKGNLNRSLNENQRSLVQKVIYCYTKSSKNNIDNFENHNYKLLLNIKNLNYSFVSNNCPSLINFRNLFRPWQFYPKPTS